MHLTQLAQMLYIMPSMMWRTALKRPLSAEALQRIQNKKLRALVKHSYAHVPYYHTLMRHANVYPDDIQTIDDLQKIPITRKRDLVNLPVTEVVAANVPIDQCYVLRTSGTTSKPLTIYRDRKSMLIDKLGNARWHLACGDSVFNKTAQIGGVPVALAGHWFQKLGLFRTKQIPPLADVSTQITEIQAYNPNVLVSMPSLFEALCKEIIDTAVQGLNVQLVFSGGENLDEPTRDVIREALNAEIFNQYGCNEVGRIYNECTQHRGNHTRAESILVEITQADDVLSPGEEGEITVTHLDNYAMPFIRYNVEDIGTLFSGTCPCGNCAPRMLLTGGRAKDRVQLPNGRGISAVVPIETLRYIRGIRQFQLIQKDYDQFTLQIIPGREYTGTVPDEITQQLLPILGNVALDIKVVDRLPKPKTWKQKQFISLIT
jgi:phenylacetate-CoA ligase